MNPIVTSEPTYTLPVNARACGPDLTRPRFFCDVLQQCEQASAAKSESLELAQVAQSLEKAFVTFALKSLESEEEGGFFGTCEQGMGYFKDLFFEHMAADLVKRRSLGFKQALTATYA